MDMWNKTNAFGKWPCGASGYVFVLPAVIFLSQKEAGKEEES